jgi:hypothetical protein
MTAKELKAINKQIEELGGIMSEVVLEALGDLTNGALNYYQTPRVVMIKREIIDTYIEQLQQENKQLKNDNAVMKANLIQVSDKQRDLYKEVIEEVRDKLYCWGEVLDAKFQQEVLQILDKAKGEDNG